MEKNITVKDLKNWLESYGFHDPQGQYLKMVLLDFCKAVDAEGTVEFTPPKESPLVLPKDKRAVRTKSTGDRVYLIDETAKTKAWVTSPEILAKLGFELSDVEDVEDSSLLGYAMTASVYRVE